MGPVGLYEPVWFMTSPRCMPTDPAQLSALRVLCIVISMAVALPSGIQYAFGVYGSAIQRRFNWSDVDVQGIGSFYDAVDYTVTLPAGLAYDAFGGTVLLTFASASCIAGFSLLLSQFGLPVGAAGSLWAVTSGFALVGLAGQCTVCAAIVAATQSVTPSRRVSMIGGI